MLYLNEKSLARCLSNKASLLKDADRTGLEPATSAVTGRHSNQLNYRSLPDYRKIFSVFGTAKIRGLYLFKQIFSRKNYKP